MTKLLPGVVASGISGHLWAPVGAYEQIASTTVGAGGTSSITFSGIPQTYQHLQIRGTVLATSGTSNSQMNFNSDTGSNYIYHQVYGSGSSANGDTATGATSIRVVAHGNTVYPGVGVIDILDYANTSKYTTTRTFTGTDFNNTSTGYVILRSGVWISTSAVTSIVLTLSSGNYSQYTQFSLYGVN